MRALRQDLILPRLERGDRVRVIAPGGAFDRSRLDTGLELLLAAGLNPIVDDAVGTRDRYFAGSQERRIGELLSALADKSARAIWVARGGYGAAHLLPHASVEAVRAAGQWLIGFSDVTALHALWQRAGLPSLHGANVINLPAWDPAHRTELLAQLMRPEPMVLRGEGAVGEGAAEGIVTGGNLTVLASLAGTGYLPPWQGALLFIEDVGERPYRLDRCITQLHQSGALQGVRGVAIGQLTDCDDPSLDYTARDMVLSALQPLGVPVVYGLPVGHEAASRAVPFGVQAVLDASRATLTVG